MNWNIRWNDNQANLPSVEDVYALAVIFERAKQSFRVYSVNFQVNPDEWYPEFEYWEKV